MFLDTVNPDILNGARPLPVRPEPPFAPWLHFPHTVISHHGSACCEAAREWFLAMDYSLLAGSSPLTGPRWIRARYDWGPSSHPIHWCEAVRQKSLDCGVLAALSVASFQARGVPVFPAQLIQRYSDDATAHWAGKWEAGQASLHWIRNEFIYHEGCAVPGPDGSLRLWDASAAWWVDPEQHGGYGSLAALRIIAPPGAAEAGLQWGPHRLRAGQWQSL